VKSRETGHAISQNFAGYEVLRLCAVTHFNVQARACPRVSIGIIDLKPSMKQPNIVGQIWFNSKPLTPEDLRGKIVLVDFWTYSCVNCQRTILYLKAWWKKYKDDGLIIIGVHTPEFEFEKDPQNVKRGIGDLGVEWPVVLDNEYANWNNFANHYWPAKYLVDQRGDIVYSHFGEGAYEETEREIQKLLRATGQVVSDIQMDGHAHGERGDVCFISTPETYCGYERGRIVNFGGYRKDEVFEYRAPRDLEVDSLALSGKFLAKNEYMEPAQNGAMMFLRFRATEVDLVIDAGEYPGEFIEITLNGVSLPGELWGDDISEEGLLKIIKPKMYGLVRSKKLLNGVLGVKVIGGRMRFYAFTFSGCEK
jgi:thiol-disulfide isomerase/thioredoxin